MIIKYPERIVCLTEETTETLYLIGEQDRIVGISGFTVRPPQARREKPKVSAFTSAKIDKILELKPDLVLGFSDMQADIAQALIKQGIAVHVFNHRTIIGIYQMIQTLGALIGCSKKAQALITSLHNGVQKTQQSQATGAKPKIWFEEWDTPLIGGIAWVSQLLEIAGGIDCFAEFQSQPLAAGRIISDPQTIIAKQPDIIIGSWCGKKFRPEKVMQRPNWDVIPAVQHQQLYEIKSPYILQPGPAALTDGLQQICSIINNWRQGKTSPLVQQALAKQDQLLNKNKTP